MEIELLMQDASEDNINYLEALFFNLHGIDVAFRSVAELDPDKFSVIHLDTYMVMPERHKQRQFFLFYYGNQMSQESLEDIAKLGRTTPECYGIFDLDRNPGHYIPFINSFLQNIAAVESQKGMMTKLNSVIQSILSQLQRVKTFHDKVVPVRNESVRGVKINSRFCAGTSSGGEFFDCFRSDSSLWLVSISATSYLAVGTFLGILEEVKMSPKIDKDLFISKIRQHIEEFKELGEVSLFMGIINLNTYEFEVLNLGQHEVISSKEHVIGRNESYFPSQSKDFSTTMYQLGKGEQIVLLSPGFFKNSTEKLGGINYYQYIKNNWLADQELIQEITFQTKNKYKDLDFLPCDQIVLTIGVDKNAISKI